MRWRLCTPSVASMSVSPTTMPRRWRGRQRLIASALDTLIEAETFDATERSSVLDRITLVESLANAVDGAHLIVEAVVESIDVKRDVYARSGWHCPRTCDPRVEHIAPRRVSANSGAASAAQPYRPLVYAALYLRPRRPGAGARDATGRDRDHACALCRHGQGAHRVQNDAGRLCGEQVASGAELGSHFICSTKVW